VVDLEFYKFADQALENKTRIWQVTSRVVV